MWSRQLCNIDVTISRSFLCRSKCRGDMSWKLSIWLWNWYFIQTCCIWSWSYLKATCQWELCVMAAVSQVDSFTVPLHSPSGRHLPAAIGLCKGTVCGIWKMAEISSGHATIHCDWGNPNPYLDQPNTKWWCKTMPPTSLAALMPSGCDCVTVYQTSLLRSHDLFISQAQ